MIDQAQVKLFTCREKLRVCDPIRRRGKRLALGSRGLIRRAGQHLWIATDSDSGKMKSIAANLPRRLHQLGAHALATLQDGLL